MLRCDDGIKALKIIRELEGVRGIAGDKRVKVIFTTALGKTEYVLSGLQTGLEVYICKPVEKYHLDETMKNLGLTKSKNSI